MSTTRPDSTASADRDPRDESVYVVIPAYNESVRLGRVLRDVTARYVNVVVVDDGSSDATSEVAAQYPVHLLRHSLNRGQGAALQTGIDYSLAAGASYVVTYDADGQHDADDIAAMLSPVMAGECQITLGSRFLDGRSNVPRLRRWLLQLARLFTWATSGIFLSDCHNGFRALTRRAAECIRIQQDRMAHASEIYDQLVASRLSYREVPVRIRYSDQTLAKGQSGAGAARIVWEYLIGKLVT